MFWEAYKTKGGFLVMKKRVGLIVLLLMVLTISALGKEVLLYEANFDNSDARDVDWIPVYGEWDILGSQMVNFDLIHNNTNIYQELEQFGEGVFIYEYKFTPDNRSKDYAPCVGLHFMASDGEHAARGDSYLIFQDANELQIYRSRKGNLGQAIVQVPGLGCALGQESIVRIEYHNTTGLIEVYVNGKKAADWTDHNPIDEGYFISLRTNCTAASYDYVKVWFRDN